MVIYFVLLGWSLLSAYLCYKLNLPNKDMKKIYLILNFLPMIIISGLRKPGVGTDSEIYYNLFYEISSWDILSDNEYLFSFFDKSWRAEPGYALFNQFVYFFSNDGQIFLFMCSIVILIGFAYFIYKNSDCVWFSTFLFIGMGFYPETFNTIRQCFAIMISCNAYSLLKNNKKWLYCLVILIATKFHASSMLLLPISLLIPINQKKYYFTICICVGVTLIVYFGGVEKLSTLLINVFPESRFLTYLMNPEKNLNYGHSLKMIYLFFWIVISTFIIRRNSYMRNEFWLNIFLCIACLITFLQCFQAYIFARFFNAFAVYICLLIPNTIEKINFRDVTTKYVVYNIIFIITIFYLFNYLNNYNANFAYQTFF